MDEMNQIPQQTAPKKSVGPVIGIIIIILVLIIGALYFWGSSLNKAPSTDVIVEENQDVASMPALNSSDEIVDIANDLNSTVLEGIDTTSDIEGELNSI